MKEKIHNICIAGTNVCKIRKELRSVNRDFQCVGNMIVVNSFNGVHVVDNGKLPKCSCFDKAKPCGNLGCTHIVWNHNYIDLLNRLRVAKYERNQAILNLFRSRKK